MRADAGRPGSDMRPENRRSPRWNQEPTTRLRPVFADVLEWAESIGEEPATFFRGDVTTYRALAEAVDRVASGILAAGVEPGDRVATLSTPRPEFLVTYLAASSVGAVWQGLNPKYTARELSHVVHDAGAQILFTLGADEEPDMLPTLLQVAPGTARVVSLTPTADADLAAQTQSRDDFLAAGNAVSASELDARRAQVQSEDPAIVVYTSGTTGRPKGALVRHSGLSRLAHIQHGQGQVERPRTVCNQPINHIGCVGDICSVTLHGKGALVFTDHFDPAETLALIENFRVDTLFQIPTQLQMLAADPHFATSDLSSLRTVAWGGGVLAATTIDVYRETGAQVHNTYGLTEVTSSVSYSSPAATNDELTETVGQPDPELRLRFLGEEGRWAGPSGPGEVCVKDVSILVPMNDAGLPGRVG